MLARLKHETQQQHQKIEVDLNLLDPCFTVEDYRAVLLRFLGFYAPWENAVRTCAPSLLEGRSKCAALMADLQYFDVPLMASSSFCTALPPLNTPSEIMGSLYVLEGATLGGQILQRHFAEKFGLDGHGCTFFAGYGSRIGAMWKQFGELLNALPPQDANAVVASAIATFEAMHAWLCTPAFRTVTRENMQRKASV